MTRLTNVMRENVITAEVNKKFYDSKKEIRARLFKEIEKELKKQIPVIPENLRKYVGYRSYIELDKGSLGLCGIKSDSFGKFPVLVGDYGRNVKSTKVIRDIVKEYNKIDKAESKFYTKLSTVLNAFTTVKKLIAEVPELEKHFEGAIKANTMAVVPVDTINNLRKDLQEK